LPTVKKIRLQPATPADATALAALHTAVAEHLTKTHGQGPWSGQTSEKSVLFGMRQSTVYVHRHRNRIIATLRLATKKPWAIDKSYFTPVKKPLYLLAMAVTPAMQRRGIGRRCMDDAVRIATAYGADAIRLDAYDAVAGAGPFYARCGFTEVGRASYRNTPLVYYELLIPARRPSGNG
jgi:GNAT superfamily N-acetyltransferase